MDIGAIEFIHRKLVELRDAGCAVLLVSAELEEVMSLLRSPAGHAQRPDRRRGRSGGGDAGRVGMLMTGRDEIAHVAVSLDRGAGGLRRRRPLRPADRRQPDRDLRLLIGSALWWPDGIGYTLFLATPLIFTGLAVAVAFRAGLLNIGAEGQLYSPRSPRRGSASFANPPGAGAAAAVLRDGDRAGAMWGAIRAC